jgi:hypothetical protein
MLITPIVLAASDKLRKEVIFRFTVDKKMRESLRITRVHWQTPIVDIQNTLLTKTPYNLVSNKGKSWYPPTGSELFLLLRVEHDWGKNCYEYFLLKQTDKNHFLIKRFGNDNCLRVIEENEHVPYFGDALENILLWQPAK